MVQNTLEKTKKLVWPEIRKYLKDPDYPSQFRTPTRYKKDADFFWKTVKEYPERQGKYLRPTLLLLACEAMGGNIQKALKTASAMQISEDWLLIHDDFEDKSLERRGKPALQRLFGDEQAVNAGDALHMMMWKILNDNPSSIGVKKTQLIHDEFYKILFRTALGQSTEISWFQGKNFNYTDKDWFFIADGKTSYYTIAGPIRLGAILGGANQKQLSLLADFGLQLGRCFQLVDDVLDLTSDFQGQKKQKGNDIFEGKRTLILGHLLRSAKKEDKKRIIKILSKTREQKTQKEIDWILDKIDEYNSIKYAQGIARKLRDEAKVIFDTKLGFLKHEPARSELKELIDFILERKY